MHPNPSLNNALKAFIEIRKKPLLVLVLPEINRFVPLRLTEILNGHHFEELDVLLVTPGGDADAAYLIATTLKRHSETVNIVVPLIAKSAGTLVSLCGDSLLMTELSELGPLDAQVTETKEKGVRKTASALNDSKALEQVQYHCLELLLTGADWLMMKSGNALSFAEAIELSTELTAKTAGKLYDRIDPMQAGKSARDLAIGEKYASTILQRLRGMTADDAGAIANRLVNGYPSHEFVLDCDELVDIGLPATLLEGDEANTLLALRRILLPNMSQQIIELMLESNQGENDDKRNAETVTTEETASSSDWKRTKSKQE